MNTVPPQIQTTTNLGPFPPRPDFPGGSDGKAFAYNVEDPCSIPGSGRYPEKEMATHSSILVWKIQWTRSLVGYNPWGRKELDMTERLHFHFSGHIWCYLWNEMYRSFDLCDPRC